MNPSALKIKCQRQDLNLHASRHVILSHAWLPITPLWLIFAGAQSQTRTDTVEILSLPPPAIGLFGLYQIEHGGYPI
jgi:hypothetical protein